MPAIVVLVKHVPDTWSTRTLEEDFTMDRDNVDLVIDEVNEYAVEQALRLKEANEGYEVVALCAGPAGAEEALRKALAMGADRAVLLQDDALAGSDVLGTSWALFNAINQVPDVQLVITGAASSDGSMGQVPGILAEYRQQPALTYLKSISIEGDTVRGVRETADGDFEIEASLPAVVSISDKADKPRFPNFKGIMAAKKAEIQTLNLAAIGVAAEQVGLAHAATAVTQAQERPKREAGERIYGNPEELATKIAQFLADEKLI
ncbi:electron transfer flavoprotein subunit beta/FixA family protein [Corynebacterium pseudopelargi]|uniref:Electron transfer flavoprotein subunit beta n=1 Tax=Corynebacterium pseudopelargi TaxID=2080757 RepID=A0A3G6IZR9_9CORY|nr:electron transfer flavoprotein subunit beta/FixA family protein [Corynebacterium pseudopelargi]AZA09454.1 Electron transfer flavoprotein subunit beta [Corynebacterium pseudopelargi]